METITPELPRSSVKSPKLTPHRLLRGVFGMFRDVSGAIEEKGKKKGSPNWERERGERRGGLGDEGSRLTRPGSAGSWGGGRGASLRCASAAGRAAVTSRRAPFPSRGGWGLGAPSGRGVKEGEEEDGLECGLGEDPGGAEEAEAGEGGARGSGRRASPAPDPGPAPRRFLAAARVAAGTRCGARGPAGGEAPVPARPGRSEKAKVRRAALLQVFPTSPLRRQASCCSARPHRAGEWPKEKGRGGGGGGGRGSARQSRESATSVKTWGEERGEEEEEEEGRREREGGKRRAEGQLFHPACESEGIGYTSPETDAGAEEGGEGRGGGRARDGALC
nr:uncharacterized protein LOC116154124 [Camelus dromedarius]